MLGAFSGITGMAVNSPSGYVADEDLPALYQSAIAFAYPSRMEGFGLPVLEAMASGAAVIASRIEPLTSLVGNAGWLADPGDPEEWRDALVLATRRTAGQEEVRRAAVLRSLQFTWERTAIETMKSYLEACG